MKTPIAIFAIICGLLVGTLPARAASNQTWVSGTGADAGACTIASPCQHLWYAYGQTNAGGVINVVSSGDFGMLTISKSISIVSDGAAAGVYAISGIKINGGAGTEVSLRGLNIDLFGSNNSPGIHFMKGAALHVSNCTFRGSAAGIRFAPTAAGTAELYVADSVFTNSVVEGIAVTTSGGANVKVMIERVRVENSGGNGITFDSLGGGPINATVRDSVSSGNSGAGINAVTNSASPNNVMVHRTASTNNGTFGVIANGATIRIGDSTVSGNNTGLSATAGGTIASYGNNQVNANFGGGDGAPTLSVLFK